MSQLDMTFHAVPVAPPDPPPLPVSATPTPPRGTPEQRFRAFHKQNPEVYVRLVRMARQAKGRGYRRLAIATLFETLRWESMMDTTTPDPFKLNNSHRASYARMIMEREVDLDGMFETRKLTSEE